jgi:hypothetical protein
LRIPYLGPSRSYTAESWRSIPADAADGIQLIAFIIFFASAESLPQVLQIWPTPKTQQMLHETAARSARGAVASGAPTQTKKRRRLSRRRLQKSLLARTA